MFEIVGVTAKHSDHLAIRRAALCRDGNRLIAAQVAAGERIGIARDFFRAARRDQVAAGIARPRTQVHNVVGAANRLFVVLDDEHGVTQIA